MGMSVYHCCLSKSPTAKIRGAGMPPQSLQQNTRRQAELACALCGCCRAFRCFRGGSCGLAGNGGNTDCPAIAKIPKAKFRSVLTEWDTCCVRRLRPDLGGIKDRKSKSRKVGSLTPVNKVDEFSRCICLTTSNHHIVEKFLSFHLPMRQADAAVSIASLRHSISAR